MVAPDRWCSIRGAGWSDRLMQIARSLDCGRQPGAMCQLFVASPRSFTRA